MHGSANRRLLVTALDQAASSASNFVLIFLLASATSPGEFGLLVIGYAILTFAVGVGRSAFGAVLGIDLPQLEECASVELVRRTTAGGLLLAIIPTVALLAMAVWLRGTPSSALTLAVLAVASPLVLLQDVYRYWAVADARPSLALLADTVWLLPCLGFFVFDVLSSRSHSPVVGALSWATGLVLSIAIFTWMGHRATPLWRGAGAWLWADPRRRHLAADAGLALFAPLGSAIGIAGVATPSITAAVRGAGTLFGPLNVVNTAVVLGAVPEVMRSSPRRGQRLLFVVTVSSVALAVFWGLLLLGIPQNVGRALLGATWMETRPLLIATTCEYVGLGLWVGATALFRSRNATMTALRFRTAYAVAVLILPVAVVAVLQTAIAASVSLAGLALCFGAVALVSARRSRT